jgi:two-component system sensor histidine kinase SenX3
MDEAPNSPELFLFLASTAHDMKNSISVLSGTLERLIDGAAPPIAQPQMAQMAQMLYQTRRLNDNLMQLLALYKQVGKPGYPIDVQPLEIGHLIDQVAAAARVLLESRGVTLEVDAERDLLWHFDEDLIAGVVAHAINNAVNYTRDRIRLAIGQAGDCLEIRIEDNGAGYPAPMLEAGVAAAGGATGGINFLTNSTGLGLYFSSEVARMHRHRDRRGALRLENGGALGGGCFVLTLP